MKHKTGREKTPDEEMRAFMIDVLLLIALALVIGGLVYSIAPALW